MNLRIHRLAVAEIDHEVDYYESQHPGLGIELEDEIDAAFSLIRRFPEAAPQWRERSDRRVAVLDRFPFTITYLITPEHVVVLALAHTAVAQTSGPDVVSRLHEEPLRGNSLAPRQDRAREPFVGAYR